MNFLRWEEASQSIGPAKLKRPPQQADPDASVQLGFVLDIDRFLATPRCRNANLNVLNDPDLFYVSSEAAELASQLETHSIRECSAVAPSFEVEVVDDISLMEYVVRMIEASRN